jgi:hypothetical protein
VVGREIFQILVEELCSEHLGELVELAVPPSAWVKSSPPAMTNAFSFAKSLSSKMGGSWLRGRGWGSPSSRSTRS